MGRLIYFIIASLDGFIEDSKGSFQWSAPSEDAFKFVNTLSRGWTTQLLGRRMYEVMLYWENFPVSGTVTAPERDFARQWQAADKIVYSRSMQSPSSRRTRIEREFKPAAIRRLKRETRGDLSVAGAELAGQAIRAGLVDELHILVAPIVVGGGKPWLPPDVKVGLELVGTRTFGRGHVLLSYKVRNSKTSQPRNSSRLKRRGAR